MPSKYSDDPKERNRLKAKAYRERHPEKIKTIRQKHFEETGHLRRIESGCRRGQTYYQIRKDHLLEKANTTRRANKEWAVAFLGGKCAHCLQSYPLEVYDFHHVDPAEKDHNPCRLLQGSRKKLEAEMLKCILLCANCHRIHHHSKEKDTA